MVTGMNGKVLRIWPGGRYSASRTWARPGLVQAPNTRDRVSGSGPTGDRKERVQAPSKPHMAPSQGYRRGSDCSRDSKYLMVWKQVRSCGGMEGSGSRDGVFLGSITFGFPARLTPTRCADFVRITTSDRSLLIVRRMPQMDAPAGDLIQILTSWCLA